MRSKSFVIDALDDAVHIRACSPDVYEAFGVLDPNVIRADRRREVKILRLTHVTKYDRSGLDGIADGADDNERSIRNRTGHRVAPRTEGDCLPRRQPRDLCTSPSHRNAYSYSRESSGLRSSASAKQSTHFTIPISSLSYESEIGSLEMHPSSVMAKRCDS